MKLQELTYKQESLRKIFLLICHSCSFLLMAGVFFPEPLTIHIFRKRIFLSNEKIKNESLQLLFYPNKFYLTKGGGFIQAYILNHYKICRVEEKNVRGSIVFQKDNCTLRPFDRVRASLCSVCAVCRAESRQMQFNI